MIFLEIHVYLHPKVICCLISVEKKEDINPQTLNSKSLEKKATKLRVKNPKLV